MPDFRSVILPQRAEQQPPPARSLRPLAKHSRRSIQSKGLRRTRLIEALESRCLLSASPLVLDSLAGSAYRPNDLQAAVAAISSVSTTNSDALVFAQSPDGTADDLFQGDKEDDSKSLDDPSRSLINSTIRILLDQFRDAPEFAGIDGTGFSTVILDTGIDLDHPHFGVDADSNGIADRILYQESFVGATSADDGNGHGTHVSGIVASEDAIYTGMAPAAGIIGLQVLNAQGNGTFGGVELALQWVIANATTYNIASVNMSLSDRGNYTEAVTQYGISDELAALAALDVIVVSASGNEYAVVNAPGVGYPAADPNSLSVGSRSATSSTLSSFSQRHPELTTVFAPGSPITAARHGGGVRAMSGTSMASPHVAGIAVLMQQLAVQELGRRLTTHEFETLLRAEAVDIALIESTGAFYPSMDVLALGHAVRSMAASSTDLRGLSLDVNDVLERGESSSAEIVLENLGEVDSGPVTVDLYLSTNQSISTTGDILLGSTTLENVPGLGASSIAAIDFTLPDANHSFWSFSDNYTIGAVIDRTNLLAETDEGNNHNQGAGLDLETVTINNLPRDLRGVSLALSEVTVLRGDSLMVDFQIENIGLGPSEPTDVAIFLTPNGTINPSIDRLLTIVSVESIVGGGTSSIQSIEVTLPGNADAIWQAGTSFSIGMMVDIFNLVSESDEANNLNHGLGIDLASLTVLAPPERLRGIVFQDLDQSGSRLQPFFEPVSLTRAAGAVVAPQITTTLTFQNLPAFYSDAVMRVQAYGDLDEVAEFATIDIEGLITQQVFDKEAIASNQLVNVEESFELSGAAWEAAMLDGELTVNVSFTNPGSVTTSTSTWLRVTLEYIALSTDQYVDTQTVENRVHANRPTTVTLDGTATPIGDGTLTLVALGDVGGLEESAVVDLEGLIQFTFLDEIEGGADSAEMMESGVIPLETLVALLANGTVTAAVNFNAAVNNLFPGNFFQLRLDYPIASEPGLGGVTVMLDVNEDGMVDRYATSMFDDPTTSLNETGMYEFFDVGFGDFAVEIVAPADSLLTAPTNGKYSFALNEGESRTGLDFGLLLTDSTPPTVSQVIASSSAWSTALVDRIGNGNGLGFEVTAGGAPLPWAGIDRLYLQFTEAIQPLTATMFELRDSVGSLPFSLDYDPINWLATLSLPAGLPFSKLRLAAADSIVDLAGNALDGDDTAGAGGIFDFRFDVLPGDANGDGRVNGADLTPFGASFNAQVNSPTFNPRANWNGDDRVNGTDLTIFSSMFNQRVETLSEPGAPFGSGGGAARFSRSGHGSFFNSFADDDEEEDEHETLRRRFETARLSRGNVLGR